MSTGQQLGPSFYMTGFQFLLCTLRCDPKLLGLLTITLVYHAQKMRIAELTPTRIVESERSNYCSIIDGQVYVAIS